jgi:hypothetical protein
MDASDQDIETGQAPDAISSAHRSSAGPQPSADPLAQKPHSRRNAPAERRHWRGLRGPYWCECVRTSDRFGKMSAVPFTQCTRLKAAEMTQPGIGRCACGHEPGEHRQRRRTWGECTRCECSQLQLVSTQPSPAATYCAVNAAWGGRGTVHVAMLTSWGWPEARALCGRSATALGGDSSLWGPELATCPECRVKWQAATKAEGDMA